MSNNQSIGEWIASQNRANATSWVLANFTEDENKIWPFVTGVLTVAEIADSAGVTVVFAHGVLEGWAKKGLITWLLRGPGSSSSPEMSSPRRAPASSGGFQAIVSRPAQSSGGFRAVTASTSKTSPMPTFSAYSKVQQEAVNPKSEASSTVEAFHFDDILLENVEADEPSENTTSSAILSSKTPQAPSAVNSKNTPKSNLDAMDLFGDIVEESSSSQQTQASQPLVPPATSPIKIPGASSGSLPRAGDSREILQIPGASSGSLPRAGDSREILQIPGASSGSLPRAGDSREILQIPGASSGSLPRAGDSREILKIPGASSGSLPRAGDSREILKIPGASSGSLPRAEDSREILKIPGASSGGLPRAGDSREILQIPEARSMFVKPGEMAAAEGLQFGMLLGNRESSEDSNPTTLGASPFLDEGLQERMEITEDEQAAFEEAAEIIDVIETEMKEVKKSKVAWAREITTAFARVTRTFQLYDANNSAVKDALTNLFEQLMSFLRHHNKMLWVLQPFSILLDNEKIYENDDREHSIAYKLYRDGIRGVTIFQGLSWKELAQLLKILGMRYGGVHVFEDDVATLFWKSNFRHIEVIAIEGFGVERREKGEEPSIQSLFRRVQRIHTVGRGWQRAATPEEKSSVFGGARGRGASLSAAVREENAQGLLRELSSVAILYQELHKDAVKPLHVENDLERLHQQMSQLFQYVDKIVLDLSSVTGIGGLRHLIREYRNFLITEGRPEGLLRLLRRAERWTKLVDSRGRLLAPLAEELLHSLEEQELIRRLLGSTKILDDVGNVPEETYEVLTFGNRDRRPMLLDILQDESSSRIKEVVRRVLVRLCGDDINLFIRGLQRGSTDLSLELIDCLQMVGTREALEVIASLMESSITALQEKVVSIAEDLFQGPETFVAVRGVLLRMVESENTLERFSAYRLMESNADHRWVPMLRKELLHKRIRGDKEVIEMCRLAARLDAKGILPLLLKWVEPPRRLSMESAWRKQVRLGAIHALGQMGSMKADQPIKTLMNKVNDEEIHFLCKEALREMRRNRGINPLSLPKRLTKEVEETKQDDLEIEATVLAESRQDLVSTEMEVDVKRLQDMMIKSLQQIDFKTENEFSALIRDLGHQFVLSLHMLVKNRVIYDPNNAIFDRPLDEIILTLYKLLEHLMSVTLVAMEGQLYINDVRVRAKSESSQQIFRELSSLFETLELGGITFLLDLRKSEWRELVDYLSGHGEGEGRRDWRDIRIQLGRSDFKQKLSVFGHLHTRLTGEKKRSQSMSLPEIYIDACDAAESVWYVAQRGQSPNPLPIRRFVNDTVDALLSDHDKNFAVLALEDPDEPLKTHCVQTALLSLMIGKEIQLSRTQLADLGMAAFFHDLGHIVFVDPSVRRGDGWQALNHQQAGMGLLLKHRGFTEAKVKRLLTIMEHHSNASPLRSQVKPSLYSRIVRVADAYDTLTSELSGGAPLSPTEALEHIASGCEKHFDPICVQALINVLGHYPTGTIVALNNGTIAVSMGNDGTAEHFELPKVLCLYDSTGEPIPAKIIDLSENREAQYQILGIVPYDPDVQAKKHIMHRVWPDLVEAVWDETMFGLTSISPPSVEGRST